jgi:hypothetical protein
MSKNNLWVRVLSSSAVLEPENRERFPERVTKASAKLESAARSEGSFGGRWGGGGGGGKKGKESSALAQGVLACSELAIEQCKVILYSLSLTKQYLPLLTFFTVISIGSCITIM